MRMMRKNRKLFQRTSSLNTLNGLCLFKLQGCGEVRSSSPGDLLVELEPLLDQGPDVRGRGELLQKRDHPEQLVVLLVIKPRLNGNAVAELEPKGLRRVVDDDGVLELPAEVGE